MVELVGWKDGAFCDPKVLGNIAFWLKDDFWVSDGIQTVLVDKTIEGCKVIVVNVFTNLGLMMQLDGIGSLATESITGVEWRDNVHFANKVMHLQVALLELSPLTFPYLFHVISVT